MAQEERVAELSRTTKETDISLSLDIDGTGKTSIDTGVAFFDHMLDAFGRHGLFDLNVKAEGDIEVDAHHTVEDVGIVLGKAFAQAMGEKRGITRFASQYLPMDETLVLAAVDISAGASCIGTLTCRCACLARSILRLPRNSSLRLRRMRRLPCMCAW